MLLLGYHTSISSGYPTAAIQAHEYGLDTFQFFLSSPRVWAYKTLEEPEINKFKAACSRYNFEITTVHMKYLANPSCSDNEISLRSKTRNAFMTEVKRCDLLNVTNLVMHLGSHKGRGFAHAKEQIVKILNEISSLNPKVKILLETSAGNTNSVGHRFEEIDELISSADHSDDFGVCIDTCHVFSAGYDLRTPEMVELVIEEFDTIIGLRKLRAIHLNDSLDEFNEGKDRHANIDKGKIGTRGLSAFLKHEKIFKQSIPVILETPGSGVLDDISLVRDILS